MHIVNDVHPACGLWTASILVNLDANGSTKTLRRTTWASHEEAVAFINRRLPGARLPDEHTEDPDCYLLGEVRPSRIQVMFMTGEIVDVLGVFRHGVQTATIGRHGEARWAPPQNLRPPAPQLAAAA